MSAPASNSALKIGTILDGSGIKYKIIDILGQGGFGITYLAVGEVVVNNIPGEMKFAIKEHFPAASCRRAGQSVFPHDDKKDVYKASLSDFISEAKKLHSLGTQNENIVKVNEVFEENGTAYYVMQYINGDSLASYVKSKGKLPYHEAIGLLSPIFDAVDFLHKSRINHLDIKPENIMLHKGVDGTTPILIDFGLSVHFKKNGDKTSPKGVEGVSEGYSPLEQYAGIREFNPATDIYALAATLLYAVTGKAPKSASEIRLSEIRSAIAGLVPQNAVDGICKAMRQSHEDRTQSVNAFKADLGLTSGGGTATEILDIEKEKRKKLLRTLFIGLAIILLVVAVIIILTRDPKPSESDPGYQPEDTTKIVPAPIEEEELVELPSGEFLATLKKTSALAKDAVACIQTGIQRGHFTVSEGDLLKKFISNVNSIKKNPELSLLNESQNKTYNEIVEVSDRAESVLGSYKIYDERESRPTDTDQPTTPRPSQPAVTNGTLQLGYGTWTGGIKAGKPDGKGRLTFTSTHKVDRRSSVEANPGDYFVATYDNGSLISGKLYDSAGNLLQTIIP